MISVGTSAGAVSTGLRLEVKVGHLHNDAVGLVTWSRVSVQQVYRPGEHVLALALG